MDLNTLKAWFEAKLVKDDRGAAMVEYGLLLMFIAVVAIVAVVYIGQAVSTNYTDTAGRL
jgi:Flp pilus assembly pilin Flp